MDSKRIKTRIHKLLVKNKQLRCMNKLLRLQLTPVWEVDFRWESEANKGPKARKGGK